MAEQVLDMMAGEDQKLLEKTASQFFAEHSPIERLRKLRDSGDTLGYSRDLWAQMAELGLAGLHLPEAYGGAGMSFFDLCLVLVQAGKHLVPEPFLSAVLAGEVLVAGGTEAQKQQYLPAIASGETVIAAAYLEARSRFDVAAIDAVAERSSGGYAITGEKTQVLDAVGADAFVVSAKIGAELALFLVPADAAGVTVVGQKRIDGRNVAIVRFASVKVAEDARVAADRGLPVLTSAVDKATIALTAEMLGASDEVFAQTIEYIKVRKQFGVPLGSFQSLQHRAARVYIAIELCRSAVLASARAVDERPDELSRYASLAKAKATESFLHAVDEAVQMHGGVGVTDECNVGFYLKRARVAEVTFGNAAFHRARWASVNGY